MAVKPWWESKTLWLNLLAVLIFAATYLADNPALLGAHAETARHWLAFVVAVTNMLLRTVTHSALRGTPGEQAERKEWGA